MADDDAPKSAYQIALARLKQKDREAGIEERPLSAEQRTRLAELRRVYQAKLAEREILHRSSLKKAGDDPEALLQLEEQYRRDRERIAGERDRKLAQVRAGEAS